MVQFDRWFPAVNIAAGETRWSRRGRLGRVPSGRSWASFPVWRRVRRAVLRTPGQGGQVVDCQFGYVLQTPPTKGRRSRTKALSARRRDHLGHHRWPRTLALCGVPVRPTPRSLIRIRSALIGWVRALAAGAWPGGSCRARGRLEGAAIRVTTAFTWKRTGRGLRGQVDLLELLAQLGMTTPGPRASADVTDSRSSNGGDRRLDTKFGLGGISRSLTEQPP
jgi:hypothetical protein